MEYVYTVYNVGPGDVCGVVTRDSTQSDGVGVVQVWGRLFSNPKSAFREARICAAVDIQPQT